MCFVDHILAGVPASRQNLSNNNWQRHHFRLQIEPLLSHSSVIDLLVPVNPKLNALSHFLEAFAIPPAQPPDLPATHTYKSGFVASPT